MMNNGSMLNDKVGEVAGRVWRQLRTHGPQSPGSIARSIGRSEVEVWQAIGWLAREGKVRGDIADKDGRVALVEQEMSITV
jgi:hypothetical protein